MMRYGRVLFVLSGFLLLSCSSDDTRGNTDGDAITDGDADMDTDGNGGTDADADADTVADTDVDTSLDTDEDDNADTGLGETDLVDFDVLPLGPEVDADDDACVIWSQLGIDKWDFEDPNWKATYTAGTCLHSVCGDCIWECSTENASGYDDEFCDCVCAAYCQACFNCWHTCDSDLPADDATWELCNAQCDDTCSNAVSCIEQ